MRRPRLITFDCYGTLIDWAGGVRRSAAPLLGDAGADADRFFEAWWHVDRELTIEHPYQPYRDILAADFRTALQQVGVAIDAGQAAALSASLADWEPFADAKSALRRLRAAGFELAILSNIDDDLLAASVDHLDVAFDHLVTAQQLRAYKPAPAHFEEILRRTGYAPAQILHAAASLRVDAEPAKTMGFGTVLVSREEPDADTPVEPDHTVPGLMALADLVNA